MKKVYDDIFWLLVKGKDYRYSKIPYSVDDKLNKN